MNQKNISKIFISIIILAAILAIVCVIIFSFINRQGNVKGSHTSLEDDPEILYGIHGEPPGVPLSDSFLDAYWEQYHDVPPVFESYPDFLSPEDE